MVPPAMKHAQRVPSKTKKTRDAWVAKLDALSAVKRIKISAWNVTPYSIFTRIDADLNAQRSSDHLSMERDASLKENCQSFSSR